MTLNRIVLLCCGVFAVCSGNLQADIQFAEFENVFKKEYASVEERAKRMQIFASNLGVIDELNANPDDGATYSHMTKFADLTAEEFAALNTLQYEPRPENASMAPLLDTANLATAFDWREKGAVNAVKDQKQCGSCWAFSTVANLEGVNFLKTGKLVSLSEQELVDCDKKTGDQGCRGGLPTNAFKDMIQNKLGLETESAYPYTAKNGHCQAEKSKEQVFITGQKGISKDEDQIAAALQQYGPLSIGINAGLMQHYKGGVANPSKQQCNPRSLDHGVAIVGFGQDQGKKYWIIRNSWGASWGEKGYYRIARGTGACGLNTDVNTATMAAEEGTLVV